LNFRISSTNPYASLDNNMENMSKLKQIPEESRDRLRLFVKALNQHIHDELKDGFEVDFEFIPEHCGMAGIPELGTLIDSKCLIAKHEIEEIEKGEAFIIAAKSSTLVVKGLLNLLSTEEVQESLSKEQFDDSDKGKFEEFAGTISDAVNKVITSNISEINSLKFTKIIESEMKAPLTKLQELPTGTFLVFNFKIIIEDFPETSFSIVIPRIVGEKLFTCTLEPVIDWRDRIVAIAYDTSKPDREIIRRSLEKVNIGVADFDDLKSLLNGVFREDVNIIILEVTATNWDSLLIGKRIRKATSTMNIPILLIFSEPTEDIIYSAFKLGVKDFLVKPINQDELIQTVQRLVSEAA